jgi:hypothetical protein
MGRMSPADGKAWLKRTAECFDRIKIGNVSQGFEECIVIDETFIASARSLGDAVRDGDLEEVEKIVLELGNRGSDIDTDHTMKNPDDSPFMLAIELNRLDIAEDLWDFGADINWQNENGQTAAMIAAEDGDLEALKFLDEHGYNWDIEDNWGNNARDIAHIEWNGTGDAVRFLTKVSPHGSGFGETQMDIYNPRGFDEFDGKAEQLVKGRDPVLSEIMRKAYPSLQAIWEHRQANKEPGGRRIESSISSETLAYDMAKNLAKVHSGVKLPDGSSWKTLVESFLEDAYRGMPYHLLKVISAEYQSRLKV